MTAYGKAANEHIDLTLALVIEGIPYSFVERAIVGTGLAVDSSGKTQIVCITRVSEGSSDLDFDNRRETAPTLDVDMLDDDATLFFNTLFASSTRAKTWLTADSTVSAVGTFLLDDTSALPTPSSPSFTEFIYVGAETIAYESIDTAQEITVTSRGAFGSKAQPLNGDATDGDAVYTVPPFWRGRRVSLYGYSRGSAGDVIETLLGTFIIDEAPRCAGDLTWTIRCAGVAQEFYERAVGVGLRETEFNTSGTYDESGDPWTYTVGVRDVKALKEGIGVDAHVVVEGPFGAGITKLIDTDTLAKTATLSFDFAFGTQRCFDADSVGARIRQVAIIDLPGSTGILAALKSREGLEVLDDDVLPGREPSSTYDPGWRIGAGFVTAEIDETSFIAIEAPPHVVIIDKERKVGELLREWHMLTDSAAVITADGQLRAISLTAPRLSGARAIGPGDIYPDTAVDGVTIDEESVFPLLTVKSGYSPLTGEFSREVNLINTSLAKRYRNNLNRRTVELRGIASWETVAQKKKVDSQGWKHPVQLRTGEMVVMLNDLMGGDGFARRLVKMSLTHHHLDLRIGDVVTISTEMPDAIANLPDMRGGRIAGLSGRIVSRRPRYDECRVDVTVELIDRLLHVCPAAVIASISGADVTLATTGPEVASASPTDDFFVGCGVILYDRSAMAAGTYVLDVRTVDVIVSGTVMTLSSAPTFTVENGVDYLVLDPYNSNDGTTASGYSLIEMAVLVDDDGVGPVYAPVENQPRWR